MTRKILVTGGAGYIGSAVTLALLKQDDEVVVFDDLSAGKQEKVPEGAVLVVGDMTDELALQALFAEHRFDAVVHCAARKIIAESEERPEYYFRHNVVGTLNLLSVMSSHDVPRLVFSSTAAVYALGEGKPILESSPVAPASVYGSSKLLSEMLISEFARTGKIKQYCILRYFNVAGDAGLEYLEEQAQNVFPVIARSLKQSEPFKLFGTDYTTKDGSGVRDYIHVADLVDAHLRALVSSTSGVFNIGSGIGYSVKELLAAFEAATGRSIEVEEMPRRAGDLDSVLSDVSLARSVLGWEPKRTLQEMVESTVAVYGL